jgi:hypothetical protein
MGIVDFREWAILLHLDELISTLMPTEPVARIEVKEWLFAALASKADGIIRED